METSKDYIEVYKLTQQSRNDILWVYLGGNNYSYDSIVVSNNSWRNHYSIEAITKNDNVSVGGSMTNMSYMFNGCYNLRSIPQLDLSLITNSFNPSIPTYNENVEVSVSFVANTINCNVLFNPNLTIDSLQSLINGLVDLTGPDAKTLTIGSQNIAKLTNAQRNAITAKNWTYS